MIKLGKFNPTPFDRPTRAVLSGVDESYSDWMLLLTRTRDSDSVTEVNFRVACEAFDINVDSTQQLGNGAVCLRFGHWACGWYECLVIDSNDLNAMDKANDIETRLAIYPVLSDDRLSAYEWEESYEAWGDYLANDFKAEIKQNVDYETWSSIDTILDEIDNDTLYQVLEDFGGSIEHTGNEVVLYTFSVRWDELEKAVLDGVYSEDEPLTPEEARIEQKLDELMDDKGKEV